MGKWRIHHHCGQTHINLTAQCKVGCAPTPPPVSHWAPRSLCVLFTEKTPATAFSNKWPHLTSPSKLTRTSCMARDCRAPNLENTKSIWFSQATLMASPSNVFSSAFTSDRCSCSFSPEIMFFWSTVRSLLLLAGSASKAKKSQAKAPKNAWKRFKKKKYINSLHWWIQRQYWRKLFDHRSQSQSHLDSLGRNSPNPLLVFSREIC